MGRGFRSAGDGKTGSGSASDGSSRRAGICSGCTHIVLQEVTVSWDVGGANWGRTYCWEEAQGEDTEETGLAASTIANDDELPVSAMV